MVWSCPACGREFGLRHAHVCAPALSVDAYFAPRPACERQIFEAVRGHLQSLGEVIVEPVSVGILCKRRRTFVALRPMARWVHLGLNYRLSHPRVTRTTTGSGGRPDDIDDQVRAWLTESYVEFAG